MHVIDVNKVKEAIAKSCETCCFNYPEDVYERLHNASNNETTERALIALKMLEDNAKLAKEKHIPICQDTGMVVVFMHVGYGVAFNGDINKAINDGVAEGYIKNYLRKSVVDDPCFDRINTKDNTPCVIHVDYVDSDHVEFDIMAKGFGSENMSAIAMLKPAQGIEGVKDFVVECAKKAGPNACPPMVIGVGIGGSFDYAPVLAKKAMCRNLNVSNSDERYAKVEDELLERINALNIGPLGLKGKTTALKVQIETYPTHIAALPVAVNICCHVSRHIKVVVQ